MEEDKEVDTMATVSAVLAELDPGKLGGGWRAMRKVTWGTDVLANCQIRCVKCGKGAINA